MELFEMVMKLNGSVHPSGCHTTDQARLLNLKNLCELNKHIIDAIKNDVIAGSEHCQEQSIRDLVDYAKEALHEQGVKVNDISCINCANRNRCQRIKLNPMNVQPCQDWQRD